MMGKRIKLLTRGYIIITIMAYSHLLVHSKSLHGNAVKPYSAYGWQIGQAQSKFSRQTTSLQIVRQRHTAHVFTERASSSKRWPEPIQDGCLIDGRDFLLKFPVFFKPWWVKYSQICLTFNFACICCIYEVFPEIHVNLMLIFQMYNQFDFDFNERKNFVDL